MSELLNIPSPAKLNLFLNIIGRRDDGYHELQTLFQLLDYGDTMDFVANEDGTINISPEIPGLEATDNLVYKAAKILQETTQTTAGANIKLDKVLPMGGGIGGGSSNAATTLLALNKLWACDLSLGQLAELGLQLGADVPVFVKGKSAFAEGVGDKLTAIELPKKYFLVIKPACHVATVKIFSHKLLTRNTNPITIAAVFEQHGRNDCEQVVRNLYPEVDKAMNWLSQFTEAFLTGTGACVYGVFANKDSAINLLDKLPQELEGFIATGNNISSAHKALGIKP